MKTAIIIGRFQPITTAHHDIIQEAINSYDETYVVVINSTKSIIANVLRRNGSSRSEHDFWNEKYDKLPATIRSKKGGLTLKGIQALQDEKETNPFSGMMRKKLIAKSFGGKLHQSHIISHPTADIQQIVNKVHYMNKSTDFVIVCGQDREKTYTAQIKSAFEKKHFAPEIENVELEFINRDMASADTVKATIVRSAIKDNDKETFASLTPQGIHGEFDRLRRILV